MKKLNPLDFSGGVNLLRDIRYVAENEVTYAKNLVPTRSGMLGKRASRGLINSSTGLPLGLGFPNTLALHVVDITGVDFAAVWRTTIGATPGAGVQVFNYGSISALAAATYLILPNKRPTLVAFGRKSYVVAGIETFNQVTVAAGLARSGVIIQEVAGGGGGVEIVSLTFTTSQATPVCPRTLATYHSRMVYADFGPGMEDWLIFSDRDAPTVIAADVLSANGRNFRLGGTSGRITALREMMLTSTGTPTQTVLVAFKERSMYLIQGEPGLTTDTAPGPSDPPTTILGNLVVQRVNTDAGCSSAETIVQTPYGMLWAGPDDVWLMQEGSTPRRVGTKIRPILEATPADKRYLWHAAYFNGFYRLSLFSEGQGPSEDSPCGEQWWLDLRNGIGDSPQWWGPMVYKAVAGTTVPSVPSYWAGATVYIAGDRVVNGPYIYIATVGGTSAASEGPTGTGAGIIDNTVTWNWQSILPVELTGIRMQVLDTRDGKTAQLLSLEGNQLGQSYLNTYDAPDFTGRDGVAPSGFSGSTLPSTLDDTEISVELRTAELDDGDPGTTKTHQGTEVSLAPTETVWLSVENQFNGGARVTTESEAVIASGSFTTDVSALDSALVTREFKAVTLRPDEGTRPAGITIRQRIYDTPGYVIDETCDSLGFIINDDGGLPLSFGFDVSVPHGFYEDFGHMVDAITGVFANQFLANTPVPGTEAAIIQNHNPFLGPRTAATLQWVLDPNASFILASWAFHWRTDVLVEASDPVKMKLAAMLGVNVTLQDPVSGAYYIKSSLTDTINFDSFVFNKRSAHFELNNIIHDSRPFGRRPL